MNTVQFKAWNVHHTLAVFIIECHNKDLLIQHDNMVCNVPNTLVIFMV